MLGRRLGLSDCFIQPLEANSGRESAVAERHLAPYLAVHSSRIEPLPHQITAVYGEMLSRQPLRFLLADDAGAGKTIMAGLLIKELIIRGDLERCLVIAPGNLVEQWQDKLKDKFDLTFDIVSREQIETSATGNPFVERSRLIMRLDMAARSETLQLPDKGTEPRPFGGGFPSIPQTSDGRK